MGRGPAVSARVVLAAAGVYALTLGAMAAIGMTPSVPWSFVPALLLVHVPLAYPMARLPMLVSGGARRELVVAGALAGGLVVVFLPPLVPWLARGFWVLLFFALVEIHRARLGRWGDWGRILAVLFCGYGSVWNLNYLAVAARPELHDAVLLEMDRAIYAALLGRGETGPLFPVFTSPFAFGVLQHAYTLLFSELFVVMAVLLARGEDLGRFFATTFGIYALGIATFVAWPVVGPHLAYHPELFHPALLETPPFGKLMRVWADEYALARTFETSNGYGYFVGLPSLHVAMAVWLQAALRVSPPHFWLCLPVNVVMIASTFLLGYHWIADAVAGGFATGAVLLIRARVDRRRAE